VARISQALADLHRGAIDAHLALAAAVGAADLIVRRGHLHLYPDDDSLAKDAAAWRLRAEHGIPAERIERAGIEALEPAVGARYRVGMFLADHATVTDPLGYVQRIVAAFAAAGGRVARDAVVALDPLDGGWTVRGEANALRAPHVVVSAGAWSARLLAPLGLRLPLETQRGYHARFAGRSTLVSRTVVLADRKAFLAPMRDGLRIGGTVRVRRLAREPDWKRAATLADIAARLFPALAGAPVETWMGHRPCFPGHAAAVGPGRGPPGLVARVRPRPPRPDRLGQHRAAAGRDAAPRGRPGSLSTPAMSSVPAPGAGPRAAARRRDRAADRLCALWGFGQVATKVANGRASRRCSTRGRCARWAPCWCCSPGSAGDACRCGAATARWGRHGHRRALRAGVRLPVRRAQPHQRRARDADALQRSVRGWRRHALPGAGRAAEPGAGAGTGGRVRRARAWRSPTGSRRGRAAVCSATRCAWRRGLLGATTLVVKTTAMRRALPEKTLLYQPRRVGRAADRDGLGAGRAGVFVRHSPLVWAAIASPSWCW
jgi:hypothetical protein